MMTDSAGPQIVENTANGCLGADAVAPWAFRIRFTPRGAAFSEGALNRYGVLRIPDAPTDVQIQRHPDCVCLDTAAVRLQLDLTEGSVALHDRDGRPLLQQDGPVDYRGEGGFSIAFRLGDEERLYGLGDETRDRVQKRGHRTRMVLRNVASYAPIPFLMSTNGWAVFLNTTWFHTVDAGAETPDRLVYTVRGGTPDMYLIAGEDLPTLLDRYTQLSGRPHLLPMSGYGLTFVCDERGVRARDVLYEAYEFRRHRIPCDTIGLEPDWMDTHYDFTTDKTWSQERFHIPFWLKGKDHGTFCAALRNMGFKLSLWLCCDYDLSEHEERQLGNEWNTVREWEPQNNRDDQFQDPHLIPTYSDRITKNGVPWFEHLKQFVDDGASAFKMDGANQVNFHPDRKWRNGMEDAEMHNLYPVLLGKQMNLGYREHTGRRAMIYSAGGYAGIQQYAATWAGDTGGGAAPLISLLNHGLSGHSNVSCDMQVRDAEGIHFGFMQPWSQVLSWHQYNQPWFLPEDLREMFAFYARLRYRLLPYIYSAAHVAARTGLPIMRAMPLVAPEDPQSDALLTQYMLGDAFLTAAFTDSVHLPRGRWIDYWTGEQYVGPADLPAAFPAGRGGPLFVRAGAIIPMWEPVDFVGHRAPETILLDVYPCERSRFALYEDDGITHAFEDGRVAVTEITCVQQAAVVTLGISARRGDYDGMPPRRQFEASVHLDGAPAQVRVNGIPDSDYSWDNDARILTVKTTEDPTRQKDAVVEIKMQV
jgi:alpha-glucosidase (family GH31 glycosyl hydrolase)